MTTGAFPVVAVGASAGGIEALQQLMRSLPAQRAMSIVVVQHMMPQHDSQLTKLIAGWTTMPVVQAADGMVIESGHVYVARGGDVLTLEEDTFRCRTHVPQQPGIDTVDAFFDSLAHARGTNAIAVVMSGTGSDGTAGAVRVKQAGGMVFVQDPVTASHESMPLAVIGSGAVDRVLPLEAIARELAEIAKSPATRLRATPYWTETVSSTLDGIFDLIRQQAGFDLTGYKPTPVLWRIQQRMQARRVRNFADYEALLRDDPSELETLIRRIPIHVTEFFRDPEAWAVLAREVIAPLVAERGEIRVWSAGCATGEEAYSIAMLLDEHARAASREVAFQVFATEASPEVLARASGGTFTNAALGTLSAERREQYFYGADGSYRVKRSLRENLVFAAHDLLVDAPLTNIDLIACRNLLIYLEPESIKRVIYSLHSALRVGGYLFLGRGESLTNRERGFEAVSRQWHIYRKTGPITEADVDLPRRPGARHGGSVPATAHHAAMAHRDLPSVLIDERFTILRVYGDTDAILRLPAGQPTHDLLKLVQPELVVNLKHAVRTTLAENRPITVFVNGAGEIRLTSLQTGEHGAPRILVSFVGGAQREEPASTTPLSEALRISTEELDASREELQVLNEELKASNEQLNSSNTHLNVANEQLREKIAELEMQSRVLSSGAVTTLFLDENLRVRWFTPALHELFPVGIHDVGRPITDLAQQFDDPAFIENVRNVMAIGEESEAEVKARSGRWFLRRIRPYLDASAEKRGVAVTFTDISHRKIVEERLAVELGAMQRLYEVHARLATETELDVAFNEILAAACDFTRTDCGCVHLANSDGKLELFVQRGNLVSDPVADFVRPLIGRSGERVGVLSTQFRAPYRPSEDELRYIDLLAWTGADFVERHRAKHARRTSEDRLQRIVETDAVGVLFFDKTGMLIDTNDRFLELTGWTRGEVERRELDWRRMTPPEWVAESEKQMENLGASGRIGPYEKQYLRKDGTRAWMLVAGRDLGDGTIVEFAIAITR